MVGGLARRFGLYFGRMGQGMTDLLRRIDPFAKAEPRNLLCRPYDASRYPTGGCEANFDDLSDFQPGARRQSHTAVGKIAHARPAWRPGLRQFGNQHHRYASMRSRNEIRCHSMPITKAEPKAAYRRPRG